MDEREVRLSYPCHCIDYRHHVVSLIHAHYATAMPDVCTSLAPIFGSRILGIIVSLREDRDNKELAAR